MNTYFINTKICLNQILFIVIAVLINHVNLESVNKKFYQYKVNLNSQQRLYLEYNSCFAIKLTHLYQHIDLSIDSVELQKLVITNLNIIPSGIDTNYSNFINSFIPKCDINAAVCLEHIYPSNVQYTSGICTVSTYLYGCTKNIDYSLDENKSIAKDTPYIIINASIDKTRGCSTIHKSIWSDCASLGSNCTDPKYCNTKCEYLKCSNNSNIASTADNNNNNSTNITTNNVLNNSNNNLNLCIPIMENDNDRANLCSMVIKSEAIKMTSSKCNPSKDNINQNDNLNNSIKENSSSNKFFKILSIFIGVLILGIVMSSFYYRIKLKENGVPPFIPPSFMPGFVYPRPANDSLLTNNRY